MGSYINVFLNTELTVIPGLLNKYFGKYYNNGLCNGATWMFIAWCILHLFFEKFLNALLKRMKYMQYKRLRLQCCLWYMGFYTTASFYCTATLIRNDIQFIDWNQPFDSMNSPSGHLILGFVVMLTFYLHSAFWEGFKYRNGLLASSYLCLSSLLFFSYFLRFVEGTLRLTIFISLTQIPLELARCSLIGRGKSNGSVVTIAFVASIWAFIMNYIVLVPLLFGYPLCTGFPSSTILFICLSTWLGIEIANSVPVKVIYHWINHSFDEEKTCGKDIFECSLFPPRSDATYNLLIFRKEMEERQEECFSLRKPKNRNVIFQTLKCMVAIKRKIKDKRRSSSPTMEETVEKEVITDGDTNELNLRRNSEKKDSNSDDVVNGKLQFNIAGNEGNCKFKQE